MKVAPPPPLTPLHSIGSIAAIISTSSHCSCRKSTVNESCLQRLFGGTVTVFENVLLGIGMLEIDVANAADLLYRSESRCIV